MQKTMVRNGSLSIMLLVAIFAIMTISLFHGAASRTAEARVESPRTQSAVMMTADDFSGDFCAE